MGRPYPGHHHAIIWPKSSIDNSPIDKEGYVIGWEQKDDNFKNETSIQYITIVCVCVVSSYKRQLVEQALRLFQQEQRCQYLRNLKIVAYYQPSDDQINENLPILHKLASTSGPVFHETHCPYDKQSLIWYDSFQKELGHYFHQSNNSGNNNSCPCLTENITKKHSSLCCVGCVCSCENRDHQNFQCTLTRISEAPTIIEKLHQIMKIETEKESKSVSSSIQKHERNSIGQKHGIKKGDDFPLMKCNKDKVNPETRFRTIHELSHKFFKRIESIRNKPNQRLNGSFTIQHWNYHRRLRVYLDSLEMHFLTTLYFPLLMCIYYYYYSWQKKDNISHKKIHNQPSHHHQQQQHGQTKIDTNCIQNERRNKRSDQISIHSHRFQTSRAYLRTSNILAKLLLDGILGCLFGAILYYHANWIHTNVLQKMGSFFHQTLLCQNVEWLDTVPAGFKLNKPLTKNMTREILQLVNFYEIIVLEYLFPPNLHLWAIQGLAIISIAFGFTSALVILMDFVQLVTIHISLLMLSGFRFVYRGQLQLFNSLWHLFRGKKIDVLRNRRSDSLEYDSMQLLFGMILFLVCLFFLTTVWVYYIFFTILNLFVEGIVIFGLWCCYFFVLNIPIGKLFYRLVQPNRFCKKVNLLRMDGTLMHPINKDPVACFEMHMELQSLFSVMSEDYSTAILSFFHKIPTFLAEITKGTKCSIVKTCLEVGNNNIMNHY